MQLFQNWQNIPDEIRGGVYAIGNFDGMHLGHQVLLKKTLEIAKVEKKPAGIITFEPITKVYFAQPNAFNLQLMMAHNKVEVAKELGFDYYFQLNFDSFLAHHSGQKFIENILIKSIGISHLVSGFDFVFGYERSGNSDLLKNYSDKFHYTIIEKQIFKEEKLGSSKIRNTIKAGDIESAKAMMSRNWVVDMHLKKGLLFFRCYVRPKEGEYDIQLVQGNKLIQDKLIVRKKNASLQSTKLQSVDGFARIIF